MTWLRFTLFFIALTLSRVGGASEPITVRLASGRSFTGLVDPRTDHDQLWLRTVRDSISLLRPLDWRRIEAIESDSGEISVAEMREQFAQFAVAPPDRFVPGRGAWGGGSSLPETPSTQSHPRTAYEASPARQAVTLNVAAWTANWDADVESDGVLIELQPRDEFGRPAPRDGSLRVHLWVYDPRAASDRSFRVAASTTLWLTASDFAAGAAVVRLPFAASHPEFDTRLGHVALVHARWAPPGGKVLDASTDVRIRPYSAVRDRLEQEQGVRFFDSERTGRSD